MQRCVVLMRSARRFHRCRQKSSMCLHWHSISEFQVQASQFNSKGLLLTLKHHKNHRRLSDETLGSTQSDSLSALCGVFPAYLRRYAPGSQRHSAPYG